jgi:hypothetical protein
VPTARATTRVLLTAGQLTHAPGMAAPGGPLALRSIPLGTSTVTPRLDILTLAQRRALRHFTGAAILDDDQVRVLPAGQSGPYADLRAQPGRAAAETELQETGLFYSINGEPPPLDQATTYPARGTEARPGIRE